MILTIALIYVAVIAAIDLFIRVIRSNLYDLEAARQRNYQMRHPYAKPFRHKPKLTVLVYSRNCSGYIKSCLNSIIKNRYKNLQIIVIDNASTDDSKQIVRSFIKTAKIDVRLVSKRKLATRSSALLSVHSHIKGELVLALEADQILEKSALKNAVRGLNSRLEVEALAPNIKTRVTSLASLLQAYMDIFRRQGRKSGYGLSGQLLCRRAVFKNMLLNKPVKTAYASDFCIYVRPASHLYQLRPVVNKRPWNNRYTKIWAGMLELAYLVAPVLLTYSLYLALRLHQPTLYLLTLAAASLALSIALINDEHSPWTQKVTYLLLSPLTQLFGYLYTWWQALRILVRLIRPIRNF